MVNLKIVVMSKEVKLVKVVMFFKEKDEKLVIISKKIGWMLLLCYVVKRLIDVL